MRRLSSDWTLFYKRIFPILWFGIIAMLFPLFLTSPPRERPAAVAFILIGMAVIAYLLLRLLIFSLADAVWDAGDVLLVQRNGRELRIPLAEVKRVKSWSLGNPKRVTLVLEEPSILGSRIGFVPQERLWPPFSNHIAEELIKRVSVARRRS